MIPRRIGPELGLPERARAAALEVDDAGLESLEALWPSEASSASSFAPKRLREFRAGRQVARRALGELGLEPRALERDADGVPVFPSGLVGSITHTGRSHTFAAAAVLPGARGLGLDAETLRELGPEIGARIFGREELADFAKRPSLALIGFSAKEAYYKCVFPSLRQVLEFHDVHLTLEHLEAKEGQERGSFRARSARAERLGGPAELLVRFTTDSERVLCLAVWE
jgi:4'-phosphopantetheinyl transferase EntD